MAAEALAAEAVASRLERQEEDIRWLWAEVQRLRDEQLKAPDACQAEGPCLSREVAQLRAENRDLRHRLYRLRLCLAEELSHRATRGDAGRAAASAQVTGRALRPCARSGFRLTERGGGSGRGPGAPQCVVC
jgi:threonyl-tRNA synthetase